MLFGFSFESGSYVLSFEFWLCGSARGGLTEGVFAQPKICTLTWHENKEVDGTVNLCECYTCTYSYSHCDVCRGGLLLHVTRFMVELRID